MMLKRFDDLLLFISANKTKEIIKIAAVNVLIIAVVVFLTIFLKQIMIAFAGIIAIVIANYLIFNNYIDKKKAILDEREHEFIAIISYFQFFITNSYNVYQAFQSLIAYSSPWMEEQIQSLIIEIDNDKSVKPFINFANKFKNNVAGNVMMSIYQMVDEGENGLHMYQFNSLFQQLSKSQQIELIDSKERSMSAISSYPLIGAGAITVLLTFGIISVMGEMINVL